MFRKMTLKREDGKQLIVYQNPVDEIYVSDDDQGLKYRWTQTFNETIKILEERGFRKVSEYIES